jgi:nucleotide-binding universal stress UspA family protein
MSKRSVLVALDGSELSETILERVRPLVGRDGDETFLCHVTEPGIESARAGDEYLMLLQERLSAEHIATTAILKTGHDPAELILEAANTHHPHLIAMSTHGRSGIARWARGSIAERVLRHARRPVFLVNPTATKEARTDDAGGATIERIVVALDGSDRAAAILPLVGELADRFNAEIVLAHVVQGNDDATRAEAQAEASRWLAAAQNKVADCGCGARQRIVADDNPARAMLEIAKTEWAGLLALTTHGRTGAQRWVYGSVAEQILREVDCPVLAVRASGD